jgi:hypothetical protein
MKLLQNHLLEFNPLFPDPAIDSKVKEMGYTGARKDWKKKAWLKW